MAESLRSQIVMSNYERRNDGTAIRGNRGATRDKA